VALDPLVGTWEVEKSVFAALGTPEEPATSDNVTTTREWVAGGHFLRDVTTGTIDGNPYERIGLLGYNPMDQRYEWTTADNVTTITMTYHGSTGSTDPWTIEMNGTFTDPGVTGEDNIGQKVAMQTVITILDNDHHTFELFFAPPGEEEMLADRMEFARRVRCTVKKRANIREGATASC
jgi:hypothetical protein